jgi:hypothetical protein
LKAAPVPKAILDNPQEFAAGLVRIVKTKLADQLSAEFNTSAMALGTNNPSSTSLLRPSWQTL